MKRSERIALVAIASLKLGTAAAFVGAAKFLWVMGNELPSPLEFAMKGMAIGAGGAALSSGLFAIGDVHSVISGEKPDMNWLPLGRVFGNTTFVSTEET